MALVTFSKAPIVSFMTILFFYSFLHRYVDAVLHFLSEGYVIEG
jgi:hypothetical protein